MPPKAAKILKKSLRRYRPNLAFFDALNKPFPPTTTLQNFPNH
jgi:hypothetical protein